MSSASCPRSKTEFEDKLSEQGKANITRFKISSMMNPKHQAFTCGTPGSDPAIVYIHGILGSPVEFRRIADALQPLNFYCQSLLLPGHGGSGYEFAVSQPYTWQAHVNQTLSELQKSYSKIILVGHSLGGLLALNASLQVPVNGIILLNTPIKTRITWRQISLSMRVLFSSANTHDPLISTYRDSFSVGIKDWWSLPLWIPRLLDIRRIAKLTLSILSEVTVPVMIFQSRQDETVNPDSAELLKKLLGSTISLTYLHQSTHAYFEHEEFNQIIIGIKRLIDLTINK